jgi:NADPH-dependent 2,4-dienoyl-CoA reductase/sulfur reductase-like enzyme
MDETVDLVVLGAGPAGASAAIAAVERGLKVLVLDEAPAAGGQVYRSPPPGFDASASGLDPDFSIGEDLRAALAASDARVALGRRVWFVAPGYRVAAVGPDGLERWQARAMVVATGTHERVVPFPGWTLPGVIGLGAATVLLKAQHVLPGDSTVVAGCGPLVAAVAVGIIKGGGTVAAMVDATTPGDWVRRLPALLSRPDLLMRGIGWLRMIRRAGVPILNRHAVVAAHGDEAVRDVVVAPVDNDWRPRTNGNTRTFKVDSLAVGHGLIPATEVARTLGAEHVFEAGRGGWVPVRDADCRCSVPALYAAGDCGGIAGATAAAHQGRLAGLAAARDLGKIDAGEFARATAETRTALRKAERFGSASANLMTPRSGLYDTVTPETIVCRCEDISRHEIEAALAEGAVDLNQMKSASRCGMGPCQGRMCGDTAAELMARELGGRAEAGVFTARVPLRPVPFEAIIGDYDYDEIPKPQAAPIGR